MISITQLAVVNLIIDDSDDTQKIEIIPRNGVDFTCLLPLLSQQEVPALVSKHFDRYFEQQLDSLELKHYVYRQKTYQGLRHYDTGDTLLYWNSNNRLRYLNVSVKTYLLEPILSQIEFPIDIDKRFPKTKRVRMQGKEEIDTFLGLLAPELVKL